jgi:imidazolonepropionase-like amidohydrolase
VTAPHRIRTLALIDGTGAFTGSPADIVIEKGKIVSVSQPGVIPFAPGEELLEIHRGAILPGLVDVHAHFTLGTGSRTYEAVMAEDSDELMVTRGVANLATHLRAGVTTARDCGARGNTALELRRIAQAESFPGPRLLVSGPPLTKPRGHFWFCGGEADGVEGVEARVKELIKAGIDFLKIMASGGGTVGTDQTESSFSLEELTTAVRTAHSNGLLVAAHCLSASSVETALRAGVDQLEHLNFIQPDGSRRMDDRIAEQIMAAGVYLSPTIQTGYRRMEELRSSPQLEKSGAQELAGLEAKLESKLSFISRLHALGARIVMGTDAIPAMGDYALGLRLLVDAGMSTRAVIDSATCRAAEAIGLDAEVGTVSPGKSADLIVVDGDPLADITSAGAVLMVVRQGRIVHQAHDSAQAEGPQATGA